MGIIRLYRRVLVPPFIVLTLLIILLHTLSTTGTNRPPVQAEAAPVPASLVDAVYGSTGLNLNAQPPLPLPDMGRSFDQQAKLLPNNRATDDRFGYAVALDGDTALIGAIYDDVASNTNQGSAYVFARNGTGWSQQAQLTASDGGAEDSFGSSVALDGDTALIGAVYDSIASNPSQGSAYVFVRNGTTWSQQVKLTASDGAAYDYFGIAVALDGDTALIGADGDDLPGKEQGSAYVFVRNGSAWSYQVKLTARDGAPDDYFGIAVALDGDTALIGAYSDTIASSAAQGSAYVFVRSGTTWSQQVKLIASDGAAGDFFGYSVALDGDTALIGAADDNIAKGSAYVFVRNGTAWSEQAKLTASDGATYDYFGNSVALDGETALIGAADDAIGDNEAQGSAYVFVRNGTAWSEQAILAASDGVTYDYFGNSVALDGNTILAGASYEDDTNAGLIDNGAVYVFVDPDLVPTSTPTDAPNDGPSPTPSPTPTATGTPLPGTETLTNGGFEATDSRAPLLDPWLLKNGVQDKVKCNKPDKDVAFAGLCAFAFKGSTGESSTLQQTADLSGITPVAGDTFEFSAYVNGGSGAAGKIKVVVKYSDETAPGKFTANLTATDGYEAVTGSIPLANAAISKAKVQIRHTSPSGKVWLDEVSLRHVSADAAAVIPLP